MGFKVLGFRLWGLGFRDCGLGLRRVGNNCSRHTKRNDDSNNNRSYSKNSNLDKLVGFSYRA